MADDQKVKEAISKKQQATSNKKAEGNDVEKLVDQIEKLSVLELSELVSALQEHLGVAPQAVASVPAAGQAAPSGEVTPESATTSGGAATQTVVMTDSGANKILVIKALREINPNLGLKEAKDLTENLPAEILKDAKKEEAEAAKKKLEEAGATVELK